MSSILGCMIKNIWGCSMYITIGAAWFDIGKMMYNVCDGHRMRVIHLMVRAVWAHYHSKLATVLQGSQYDRL